jgi:hypothetical protein
VREKHCTIDDKFKRTGRMVNICLGSSIGLHAHAEDKDAEKKEKNITMLLGHSLQVGYTLDSC